MSMPSIRRVGWMTAFAVFVAMVGGSGPRACGQNNAAESKAREERAERLEEMAIIARSINIFAVDERGGEVAAVMQEEPLQRWTDPTREFSDGGMWVWRAGGRPVAVVGIELYQYWSLEFASISPGLVRGEYPQAQVRWKPQKAGVEFHAIANAPQPGNTEAVRLRQMRELVHRFTAMERWADKGQFALRLLPHPIDRYASPSSGTVDGGLFVLAHGTNPEVLLLIEARKQEKGPVQWQFAAMHLSHAEVTLKLDSKNILTLPDKDSGPRIVPSDPYYDVLVPRRLSEVRDRVRAAKTKVAVP